MVLLPANTVSYTCLAIASYLLWFTAIVNKEWTIVPVIVVVVVMFVLVALLFQFFVYLRCSSREKR